ncbi:MAG: hypothetical protein SFW62_06215 [Alphaproteobacteria bacterium]|nr:hypothetical protein [Alphaproteobacteria bacterium]
MSNHQITTKQKGDACEMLIAAKLTLAGIPALKVPDNWPHYDVIAQPQNGQPLRISVRARTYKPGAAYVGYLETEDFDWLAIVTLPGGSETERRFFLIPRKLADRTARRDAATSKTAKERYWRVDEVLKIFSRFENNFSLNPFLKPNEEALKLIEARRRQKTQPAARRIS